MSDSMFLFREICVSRGGPQPHSPQHQAREAWEFSHFPKALARLVLRHAATARKTAPLQKLKRSFGLRSVRGIVVAPWRWRRVFRSATDREGPCLGPRARPGVHSGWQLRNLKLKFIFGCCHGTQASTPAPGICASACPAAY